MAAVHLGAHAAILTRAALTKVHLGLAVPAHVTGAAVTVEVVNQLYAVKRAVRVARIGQAFVDVALAPTANKPGRAPAVETAHPVHARTVVVASPRLTFVHVYIAYDAQRAGRARAAEAIDQVPARATVLAWVRVAIVHVQFAVLSLEAPRTLT